MSKRRAAPQPWSRLAPAVERGQDVSRVLAAAAGPVIDLLARLWLAQGYLASGTLKLVNWQATVFLYATEHPVPGMAPATAAGLGTAIELVCPLLLVLGLATRAAVLPLIATTLFLHLTYVAVPSDLTVLAWLGLLFVRGAGRLSLDHQLAAAVANSALPLAGTVSRLTAGLQIRVAPLYAAALRLWLGWLLGSALYASGGVAGVAGSVAGAALALGLATRPAAFFLLAVDVALLGGAASVGDPALRRLLLLDQGANGGGRFALDRLLAARLHSLFPSLAMDPAWLSTAPRVIIIGAGFGGIAAARALRHARARVTLIDRRNYHLFQPLLYQVATASLSPADIATPIRALVRDQPNCQVLMDRVQAIDAAQASVVTAGGRRLGYDYLVLATGARHSYFGKTDWEALAPGLKKIDDATQIRGRILSAFERAETTDDEDGRRRLLSFVIVGGGPTGVELAGAIAELARHGLAGEFRRFDPRQARVILVQSAPRLLPAMPADLSAKALNALTGLGVEVRLKARVEQIDAAGVLVSGERIEAETVLWAAGVMASPAGKWLGAACDNAGRIIVTPDLAVPGFPRVYALGDTAACPGADGTSLPGLAAVAKQQGHYVARVIRDAIDGRPAPGPFRYRDLGSMATIGRKAAVASLPGIQLSGAFAWWLWSSVHVALLAGARARVAVLFEWAWSYLTYGRSMRLITGGETAD